VESSQHEEIYHEEVSSEKGHANDKRRAPGKGKIIKGKLTTSRKLAGKRYLITRGDQIVNVYLITKYLTTKYLVRSYNDKKGHNNEQCYDREKYLVKGNLITTKAFLKDKLC